MACRARPSGLAGCCSSGGGGIGVGEHAADAADDAAAGPAGGGVEDVYCPTVTVIDGGSAHPGLFGRPGRRCQALRSQVPLGELARECVRPAGRLDPREGRRRRPGAAGRRRSAGRFDVPVHIVVKGGRPFSPNRSRQTPWPSRPATPRRSFAVIENGIVVPGGLRQQLRDRGRARRPSGPGRRGLNLWKPASLR